MWPGEIWPKDPGTLVVHEAGFACPSVVPVFAGTVLVQAGFEGDAFAVPALTGRSHVGRR